MSCFSCNMCTCTLTTQTKTQLIVYPVQLQSSNKQVLKNCNLKVKKNRESGDNGKQSQCASEGEKGGGKEKEVGDTMHTVSKIVSVGSLQLPKDKAQIYIVDQNSNQQERQSQLGQESCLQDKQNINSNLSSLILSPHPRILNPLSLQLQPKLAQSHLTSLLSPQLPKSPHPSSSFSPSLLQSPSLSSITQKNLQSILLQKQNTQLKQQLSRLKQVQKQLLQQQLKIRQKSNREIGHLKRKSQELEKRSQKREKQLGELRDMMRIVRGKRQGKDTGKREKGSE